MVHLYKHFPLFGRILLSTYWRETCTENNKQKAWMASEKMGPCVHQKIQQKVFLLNTPSPPSTSFMPTFIGA